MNYLITTDEDGVVDNSTSQQDSFKRATKYSKESEGTTYYVSKDESGDLGLVDIASFTDGQRN